MSRCTSHDLHHEKAPETQHIRLISEGGCSLSRSPGPVCIDSIQVTQTCTTEFRHERYRTSTGGYLILPAAGNALFSIPVEHAADLDRGVLPEVLRTRLAQQGFSLTEEPRLATREPGKHWTVTDREHTISVRKAASRLAVFVEQSGT